ncbi:MAG: methyltransferase domain-containing protein [Myxococcales bacterium]|nr:class I SAM-dependent methyltransferase [Myxococcota bacterium]MDW8283561.1 methyltransferase domain-containing protein [Myxococcales bacterium]
MKRPPGLFLLVRIAERLEALVRTHLMWEYHLAQVREPRQTGWVVASGEELIEPLRAAGFSVSELSINLADYYSYLRRARYHRFPFYYGSGVLRGFYEKALEHHLAACLLDLGPNDVFLDVASGHSPAADIYAELYGCTAYRHDVAFAAGVHGNRIGGDAANLPLPAGFVTKMALHCSFEHFEGDVDMRFLHEAARVLRPGGRLCILPLYLSTQYTILTDPVLLRDGGRSFDDDAVLACARGWGCRHGRHYDVSHLSSRLRDQLGPLRMSLYFVRNATAVHPSCYLRFVALLERTT